MARKQPGRDTALAVITAPNANRVERMDALGEMQKAHMPSPADLLPTEQMQRFIDYIRDDFEEQAIAKAENPTVIVAPKKKSTSGMRSVSVDEMQISMMGEYFEKPGMQFEAQREMVRQTPILNAVLFTRTRQIERFCKPLQGLSGPGFRIAHVDANHKMSADETDSVAILTKFFVNCGMEFNPRRRSIKKRDDFTSFMKKIVRDSLTMDSAPIECEFKALRDRGMDGFYAVDGETIRLCSEAGYEGDDEIFALQVIQGRIHTAYTRDNLIWKPRNPLTDVSMGGYGLGEPELLIRVVTGLLNAMTVNIKGFSENAIPKGILQLVGSYGPEDLAAFKRQWNAMVKGVSKRWAMPVLTTDNPDTKAAYTPIGTEFNEMYFSKWMTFLTSIICAIYTIGPDEINFESFTTRGSGLSGDNTEEKLESSKDKGLRPLLSYLEILMSDFICADFSDRYCFKFTGLDDENAVQKFEMSKLNLTVDETRIDAGRKPLGGIIGGAPLNPSLIPMYQQEVQPQPAQGGGDDQGGDDQGEESEQQLDFGDGEDNEDGASQDEGMDFGDPADNQDDQPPDKQPPASKAFLIGWQ